MGNFKIPAIPQSTQKCIRVPNELLEQVEEVIIEEGISFTAFTVEAIRYALKNLK